MVSFIRGILTSLFKILDLPLLSDRVDQSYFVCSKKHSGSSHFPVQCCWLSALHYSLPLILPILLMCLLIKKYMQ